MTQAITHKQLKQFALLIGGVIGGLFGCLIPYIKTGNISVMPLGVGLTFILFGFKMPVLLKPIYDLWMKIGHVLGWVNSRLLLSILFFGLVTPMSLVLKILGKKLLVKPDVRKTSYKTVMSERPATHMEKPY